MTSDPGSASRPRSPPSDPWYADSPKSSRPQSPNNFILGQPTNDDMTKSNSLVSKRLLNDIGRLEEVTNSFFKDVVVIDVFPEEQPHSDADQSLDELSKAISEIEELVISLQSQKQAEAESCESECFSCVTLQCENESMRARIGALEQELKVRKGRVDELSTASGKATPPPGPSPLMSASMRLKTVTAALNKALHTRK